MFRCRTAVPVVRRGGAFDPSTATSASSSGSGGMTTVRTDGGTTMTPTRPNDPALVAVIFANPALRPVMRPD
jgi:hypothetical protein